VKITRRQLRKLITELTIMPPHIPTADPDMERKIAELLTGDAEFIKQAVQMLQDANLTPHVGENHTTGSMYIRNMKTLMQERFKTKVTTYEFKVTQSFYNAIIEQLSIKQHPIVRTTLSNMISEWNSGSSKIRIFTPYNLLHNTKYRSRLLRSDEPYVEILKFEISEPISKR